MTTTTSHHILYPQDAPVFVGEWLRQNVGMTSDDCTTEELQRLHTEWRLGGMDALDRTLD